MYIVAIAWIYVVFMMSITETSATAGVMTFVLYGVFPLSIILYLLGTPQRRRRRLLEKKREEMERADAMQEANPPDQLGPR